MFNIILWTCMLTIPAAFMFAILVAEKQNDIMGAACFVIMSIGMVSSGTILVSSLTYSFLKYAPDTIGWWVIGIGLGGVSTALAVTGLVSLVHNIRWLLNEWRARNWR